MHVKLLSFYVVDEGWFVSPSLIVHILHILYAKPEAADILCIIHMMMEETNAIMCLCF